MLSLLFHVRNFSVQVPYTLLHTINRHLYYNIQFICSYSHACFLAKLMAKNKLKRLCSWILNYFPSRKKFALVISLLLVMVLIPSSPDTGASAPKAASVAAAIKNLYCNMDAVQRNITVKLKSILRQQEMLPPLDLDYLEAIAGYACRLPTNKPMIVWGPPGSGKRSGMQLMADLWRSQGRVVVVIDLSNFDGTISELNELIHLSVARAFNNTELSRQALISFDQVVKTEGEENTFTRSVLWYTNRVTQPLMRMVVKQIMLFLPFEVDQNIEKRVVDAYSDKLKSLGLYMESFFKGKENTLEEINFKDFFTAIAVLARVQPEMAPIIIFKQLSSFDILQKPMGTEFLHRFINRVRKFEETDNNIPIIISSSNTIWLKATVAADMKQLFETYEVDELGKEEGRKVAVELLGVWDEADFHAVYSRAGGRLQAMGAVFGEQTQNNCSVHTAIAQATARKCDRLRQLISKAPLNSKTIKTILESLPRKIDNAELGRAEVVYLLRKEVIYVDSNGMLQANTRLTQHAITNCLG